MQGNLVFNAKQELIYRRDLERVVVETAIDFAAKHGKPNCRILYPCDSTWYQRFTIHLVHLEPHSRALLFLNSLTTALAILFTFCPSEC